MRLFSKFFRAQHASKQLQKDITVPKDQNSPAIVDFILIDAEEEDEPSMETCTDTTCSVDCSPFYSENQAPNIPLTFHSDTPISPICPSSNFLDLRATYPSIPLPMGVHNGAEVCLNASFKGYLATLLVPCLWLVLGSYIFVATMAYVFHKSKKHDTGPETTIGNTDMQIVQEFSASGTLVPETGLLTSEEVLEYTLKQYGHLSDFDQNEDVSTHLRLPLSLNRKPKPINLDQKALNLTARKDVDIVLRGTMPDTWVLNKYTSRETYSAPWATSVHPTAMKVIETTAPVVRIPTQPLTFNGIPIRHHVVVPHPMQVGAGFMPHIPPQTAPMCRSAPIAAHARHLSPMQYQCFMSSPLRYSYTVSPPYSPGLVTPVSGSATIPHNGLERGMWSPNN